MDTAYQDLQNRYRILRVLGQGGMGSVYLCEDLRLPGKHWAVKEMLCPDALPFAARETFEREVRILSGLRHRNLPMIVDYFHEHGNEYLVMEFVEGRTLYDEIRDRGPTEEVQALRWG
ncbi:MAG: protein kinase, partial [Candidatus Eremiobacterota bacterium]